MKMEFDITVYCLIILHFHKCAGSVEVCFIPFDHTAIDILIARFGKLTKCGGLLLILPKRTPKLLFLLGGIHPYAEIFDELIIEYLIQLIMDTELKYEP